MSQAKQNTQKKQDHAFITKKLSRHTFVTHPYGIGINDRTWYEAFRKARSQASEHSTVVDREGRFPTAGIQALAEGGFLGLCLPKSVGGLGEDSRAFCAAVEELAIDCASTAMIFVMHMTATAAIESSNTLADKEKLLSQIARGEHLSTLALSEAGSRSQFWLPLSRLAVKGNGFEVSMRKTWVTTASHANSYVTTSQMPDSESADQKTMYLIRTDSPQVSVAGRFDGLGLRGNDSSPVEITNYLVPKEDLLTAHGKGGEMEDNVVLLWFVLGSTAMSNGLCQAALDKSVRHISTSFFHNTGQGLRDLPNLRARLANMSMQTIQARVLLGHTLSLLEQDSEDALPCLLQSRLASLKAAIDVTEMAMKTCGGAAYSRQLSIERHFRDARAGWVMTPTGDHLEDAIGKILTGLPPF